MAAPGAVLINPPAFKPVKFGLFSVADVRPVNDSGWAMGGITFDNLIGCGPGGVTFQPCDTPASQADVGVIEPEFPVGDPWSLLVQVTCAGPGYFAVAKDTVTAAINANRERMVEGALMTQLLADAVDHTPTSGVVEAENGIALLEGLWGQYGGAFEPTFHLDRTVALLGWKMIDRHGNHLETELGSPVAAGAGYFDPAYDEDTGTSWIVASGPVVVQQGVARALDAVFVGGSMDTDNTWIAPGYQTFAWAWPCTPIKVQVNSISDLGSL